MEKRTKVRIVAVLYLILGVFFIVLGWNAKSWYPNMFASNTYYGEWGGTTLARVAAIVVGALQVLIGSCLLRRRYYGYAVLFGVVLVLACLFFSIGVISSGDDPSFQKVTGDDFWWFFGYFILLGVNLLFFIFLAPGGKPKASALTTTNVNSKRADKISNL